MTSAVACAYADRVAAVAPVAGVRRPDGCDPARPVPLLAFHGTEDPFVAYDGGLGPAALRLPAPDGSGRTLGELGLEEGGEPSVPEVVAAWATGDGCEDEPATEEVADDVDRISYPCPAGIGVELYRVEGGGHTWPGSEFSRAIESVVGHTTFSISADEVMWAFFEDHPLTG
jgi:polyhydroxybutyrate depolymerase